ncbi:MAG: HEAT repeat domain-containing protein [Planctomycetota bacterium]
MLPNAALKPVYDKVEWVWVYRDFTGSDADRMAERISIRCGVTGWPGLLFLDAATLQVTGAAEREVDDFVANVESAKGGKGGAGLAAWREAEKKAAELHAAPTAEKSEKLLGDVDIVVKTLALRIVVKQGPAMIAARATELLAVANDAFRYEVLDALSAAPDPKATPALEVLLKDPGESRNPNVVRCRSAKALGKCGGEASIAALAPGTKAAPNNGLTGISVDAIVEIAQRNKGASETARKALVDAYPEPSEDKWMKPMAVTLAKKVHEALGKVTGKKGAKFPEVYDAKGREELMKGW